MYTKLIHTFQLKLNNSHDYFTKSQVLESYFKTYILTCYLNIFMHKNLYTHCIHYVSDNQTLPWWLSGKESACEAGNMGSIPKSERFPWRRKWQSTTAQGNPMD